MTLVELIHASIAEHKAERMRRYVSGGRRFAGLSTQALEDQWVEAYRDTRGLNDLRREPELLDLRSEFTLRRTEPPLHRVATEYATFVKGFERQLRHQACDPEELDRLEDELEDLKERLSKPKH